MKTILKSSRPNGWYISLTAETSPYVDASDATTWYVVSVPGQDHEAEYETLDDAEAEYAELRLQLAQEPNWEAQAAYDDQWGEPYYPTGEY